MRLNLDNVAAAVVQDLVDTEIAEIRAHLDKLGAAGVEAEQLNMRLAILLETRSKINFAMLRPADEKPGHTVADCSL